MLKEIKQLADAYTRALREMRKPKIPKPMIFPQLEAVNKLLVCFVCERSDYRRIEYSAHGSEREVVGYRIACLQCTHSTKICASAMEAEVLFERR